MSNEKEIISWKDFSKIDLRVGLVEEAELVPDSDKLIKLRVDIGSEKRSIISGIADSYSPEDLVGKKIIVIINLEPKVIRGEESQGMLLAGEEDGIVLVVPEKDLSPGVPIY